MRFGEVFRVDATADRDEIAIGGWEEVYGGVSTKEARCENKVTSFSWLCAKI